MKMNEGDTDSRQLESRVDTRKGDCSDKWDKKEGEITLEVEGWSKIVFIIPNKHVLNYNPHCDAIKF